MKSNCLIFLAVLIALGACDEKSEQEPQPVSFLTVTRDVNYFVNDDIWAFATDGAGKVLDAGPVEAGSSLALRALSAPDTVNVTIYFGRSGSPASHLFYTYSSIRNGDHITLESAGYSEHPPPVSGKATVTIQNCDPYTFFTFSDGHAYSQASSQSNTFVDVPLDLREGTSSILVSSHMAIDRPVYGWVDNVANAGEYAIDFNTFSPFPRTISVSFSESMSTLIRARKAGIGNAGYVMANRGFSTISPDPTLAKFGYLDGFDEYSVFATSSTTTSTYFRTTYYIKRGTTLPEQITFPDNSLTIENPLIGNFRFTYSSTYTYGIHQWREERPDHTIHWLVYSDKPATPIIMELPEALASRYPSLSLNNLPHFQSEFLRHEDGYTYGQFLRDVFAGVTAERRELVGDSFRQK